MKYLKHIILVLCMTYVSVAYADPWSGYTNITGLYPYVGGLIFNTEYANQELSTCDNGHRFQIAIDHPNYQLMSSALLAAFISGKQVNFNIESGQQPTCQPKINRFMVRP